MKLCATDEPKSIPSGDPRQLHVPTIDARVVRDDFLANPRCCEYPRHLCVHELTKKAIHAKAGAIAVESQGRTLTYAELDVCSNQLARRLCRSGRGTDERSVEMVVALLGVLEAGGR
jgi:non-ribosomal peptide synthetase component F